MRHSIHFLTCDPCGAESPRREDPMRLDDAERYAQAAGFRRVWLDVGRFLREDTPPAVRAVLERSGNASAVWLCSDCLQTERRDWGEVVEPLPEDLPKKPHAE